jgi:hypothetical protein
MKNKGVQICPKCGSDKINVLSDGTVLCLAEHCLAITPRKEK